MLNINFFGKTNICIDGVNITDKFGNKTLALLCLLTLNIRKHMSRDKIIVYLWPDSNEEAAKYNLRYNLWLIRKYISNDKNDNEFLIVDRGSCQINPNYDFYCDIIKVIDMDHKESMSIEEMEKLRNSICGDFMEGFYFKNCNEFNEIIIFERNRLESLKVDLMVKLAGLYESSGDNKASREILEAVMILEPYDEETALRIMNLYVRDRKCGAAIIFYNDFKNRMLTNLGIKPSERLNDVILKIKESHEQGKQERPCISPEKSVESKSENLISIDTFCIKPIKYFWISMVLKKLIETGDFNALDYVPRVEVTDLSFIQPMILEENEIACFDSNVPDVRIVHAFTHLLNEVSKNNKLEINIISISDMDEFSYSVYNYLHSECKNIVFIS